MRSILKNIFSESLKQKLSPFNNDLLVHSKFSGRNTADSAAQAAAYGDPVVLGPAPRSGYSTIRFVDGDLDFHEQYMPEGSLYFDRPNDYLLTRTVEMPTYVDANGATQSCTVDTSANGWSRSAGNTWVMTKDYGTWTYNDATNKLTYTFDSPATHGAANDVVSVGDSKFITFLGPNGEKHEDVKFEINVHDDAPGIAPDSASIESGDNITRAIEFWSGADGLAKIRLTVNGQDYDVTNATAANKVQIAGEYGNLEVWSTNGVWQYSYTAKNGSAITSTVTEKIGVSVVDKDDDEVKIADAIQIKIEPTGMTNIIKVDGGEVNEAHLPGVGSDPQADNPQTGTVVIPVDQTIFPMGVEIVDGSYPGKYGTLELVTNRNEEYEFRYTLNSAMKHPDGLGTNSDYDVVKIKFKDLDTGKTGEVEVSIKIIDDVPVIDFLSGSEMVEDLAAHVFNYKMSYGADGAAADNTALQLTVLDAVTGKSDTFSAKAGESIAIVIDGVNYGTVVFGAGDTFTFTAGGVSYAELELNLSVTDSDGDTVASADPFKITVKGGYEPGTTLLKGVVDEASLADGSNPDAAALTRDLPLPTTDSNGKPATYTVDVTGWNANGNVYTLDLDNGYLSYNKNTNSLTFTLTDPALSSPPGLSGDHTLNTAKIVLLDAHNKQHTVSVELTINDDEPWQADMGGQSSSATYGEQITGFWDASFGADGPAAGGGLSVEVSLPGGASAVINLTVGTAADIIVGGVNYGKLTLTDTPYTGAGAGPSSKEFIFESGNTDANLSFNLIATDADGDKYRDNSSFNFEVKGGFEPGTTLLKGVVDEASLADGSNPNAAALTRDLPLPTTDSNGQPATYTVDVTGWTPNGNVYTLDLDNGYLSYNKNTNSLTFTLTDAALSSPPGLSGDHTLNTAKIVLLDAHNKQHTVSVELTINDDEPWQADMGGQSSSAAHGEQITGFWDASFGADGPAASGGLSVEVSLPGGASAVINLTVGTAADIIVGGVNYGKLTLTDTPYTGAGAGPNSKEFIFEAGNTDANLSFNLIATDADGDRYRDNSSFNFEVLNETPGKIEQVDKNFYFDEAHLPEGTAQIKDPSQINGELEIPKTSGGDFYALDTAGWTQTASNGNLTTWELNVASGKLIYTVDSSGLTDPKLSYQLDKATMHDMPGPNPGDVPGDEKITLDVGKVTLVSPGGSKYQVSVEVQVQDDAPYVEITKGGNDHQDGNGTDYHFVSSGEFEPTFGADGPKYDSKGGIWVDVSSNGPAIHGGRDGIATSIFLAPDGTPQKVLTTHGWMELSWNPQTGKVSYVYESIKGNAGDDLKFWVGVRDGDYDMGRQDGFTITLGADVPEMVLKVNESGLPNGTSPGAATSDSGSISFDHWTREAHEIRWKTGSGPEAKADCNGDGNYSSIVWSQVGNSLIGMAEGAIVMKIDPTFQNGVFTGEFTSTLYASIQHVQPGFDLSKDLGFKYELVNKYTENGQDKEFVRNGNIAVRVNDDAPEDVEFGGNSNSVNTNSVFEGYWNADFGADGPAATGAHSVVVTVNGVSATINLVVGQPGIVVVNGVHYGEIMLTSAAYSADPSKGSSFLFYPTGNEGKLEFDFIATDKDMDSSHASGKFTLNVLKGIDEIVQVDKNFFFDESHLPDGNAAHKDPNQLYGQLEIPQTATGEYYNIDTSSGWTLTGSSPYYQTWEMQVDSGKLVYMADPAGNNPPRLMYELTDATQHGAPSTPNDTSLTLNVGKVVLEHPGNSGGFEVDVKVNVRDDNPFVEVTKGGDTSIIGNRVTSGEFTPHFGADGPQYDANGGIHVSLGSTGPGGANGYTSLILSADGSVHRVSTTNGWMDLSWNASTQKIAYTYTNTSGRPGDQMNFSLKVYDGDGDQGQAGSFSVKLGAACVQHVTLNVTEREIPGRCTPGRPSSDTESVSNDLDGITKINWNLAYAPRLCADSNLDCRYSPLQWKQVGNKLVGVAEHQVVMEIVPTFVNGEFTGEFTSTLYKPVMHGRCQQYMDIGLKYTLTDDSGNDIRIDGNLTVRVEDDPCIYSRCRPTQIRSFKAMSLDVDGDVVPDDSMSALADNDDSGSATPMAASMSTMLLADSGATLLNGGEQDGIMYGGNILSSGPGSNVLYGTDGADVFTWDGADSLQGRDTILDFSSDEDSLSFEGLMNAGQTLANFFSSNVSDMSINAGENGDNSLSFTVSEGGMSKVVEIHFDANDAGFKAAYAEYADAGDDQALQQAAMVNFLNSISGA